MYVFPQEDCSIEERYCKAACKRAQQLPTLLRQQFWVEEEEDTLLSDCS